MNALSILAENSFSIFIIYLVISSNFLAPLFSCRLQELIKNSMIVRHVLGILTLTFFVVISTKTKPLSFSQVMLYSVIFYTWFVMTTRIPLYLWYVVITLVGAIYLIYLYQSDLTTDKLTEEETERYKLIKEVLAGLAAVITLVGFLSYLGEKKIEYKNSFSMTKFLLGTPSCKGKSPEVNFINSLKGLFK